MLSHSFLLNDNCHFLSLLSGVFSGQRYGSAFTEHLTGS
jgi:hypothetical protein